MPAATPGDDAPLDDFFQSADAAADGPSGPEGPATPRALPPRLGLLEPLSDEEFDAVARAAKLAFPEAEVEVFAQGSEADRFYILVEGMVEVVRDGELLATLGPGSFFGESSLLVGGRRSATIRTVTSSALWSVSYEAFRGAVSHHLLADELAGHEVRARIDSTPEHAFGSPDDSPRSDP
ncbi:MAG: transporter [Thermoleophilia bacterium]|nr:transporter [Thermoleophilia bacterium]